MAKADAVKAEHSLHGLVFAGSVEAGDALRCTGFRYCGTDRNGATGFYLNGLGLVALVDNGCNQRGYKIEISDDNRLITIAETLEEGR